MTPGTARGRRRSLAIVGIVAVVVAVAAFIGFALVTDSSQGSAAIREAQGSAAAGLERVERQIAARDGRLDVSWSAVPSPGGRGYVVTARLEVQPSGDVAAAQFGVVGDEVAPRNELARQLVDMPTP